MQRLLLILLSLSIAVTLSAQELTDMERLLEGCDELYSEEEFDYIVSTLQSLQQSPLNLNRVGFDSLKMLFFLSDVQIDHILAFREKTGSFLHVNELLLAPGISRKDLENIRSFVFVGEGGRKEAVRNTRRVCVNEYIGRFKISLPEQEGYKKYSLSDFKTEEAYRKKQNTRFEGPPFGVLMKYKTIVDKRVQLGFTLENDLGEAYFTGNQKSGFDFFSAHLSVAADYMLQRLVVGDYRVQMGQGVVMWSGFSSGKSSVAVNNEKSGNVLSPYTSTDENRFMRGVGLTFRLADDLLADLFFSCKKTDGNLLLPDSLSEEDLITATVYESGYHRNRNECEKKHTLKETTGGGVLKWNTAYFKLGLNGVYYNFKPGFARKDGIYNHYDDKGKDRLLGSVDYKTGWQNIYLFGETARSEEGAWATLNGLRFSGSSKMALSILYRRYDKKYISRYASGFGEYSNTSNEEGIYIGVNMDAGNGVKMNFYYDRFRFMSPRYNAYIPASGYELLGEAVCKRERMEHLFRYKREVKPENITNRVVESVERKKDDYRYQLTFFWNERWETRTRFNLMYYEKGDQKERGYLLYNDIVYSSVKENFKMQFRLAYFDTDSYQARIYAYENNVLYGYSFPAYYNRGVRTYLNLNVKPRSGITFYMKAGLTLYPGFNSISSGVTKVEGNKIVDLVFQLRLKF